MDPSLRPCPIDKRWAVKQRVGTLLDRLVGLIWCSLIAAGAGSVVLGLVELVVLATLSAWWLLAGGGARGDVGYMLGNVLGRP